MMLQWTILDGTDADLEAVARLPGATIFHSPRWARVLARGFGGPVRVVALVDEAGEMVAAWPACLLKVGPVRMLYGVFPKGNFVGSAEAIAEHLAGLGPVLREAGVHLVRMIVCEDDPVQDVAGAVRSRHVRHVLAIAGRTPEDIWVGYRKKIRRDVRVPQKAGLVARPMRREEFPAFHQMMSEVFVRNAAATGLGPRFYEAVWDELAGDGTADFIVADFGGRPQAAVVAIHDGPTTYYFAGCSRTDALHWGPNDLTVHALIISAARRGAEWVDMLSSDAGDKGLIRFKEKWGAEERSFDLIECWFSPWRRRLWKAGMALAQNRAGAAVVRWVLRTTLAAGLVVYGSRARATG